MTEPDQALAPGGGATVLLGGRGASKALARQDPTFAPLVERHGPPRVPAERDRFAALVQAICSQQLSIKAAATIYGRVEDLCGGTLAPEALLKAPTDELRACGLSRAKVSFVHDLSDKVVTGALELAALDGMTDEEVTDALTAVKGIGVWTAQMLLIFTLHRPDVLPTKDLGIVDAVRIVYGRTKHPTELGLERLAKAWRPYRSVACWYLWKERDRIVRR